MVAALEPVPKFPALFFDEALARIRGLEGKVPPGTAVPRLTLLRALGYGEKNGGAMRTLNALRRYGLLDRSVEGYRISELALRILRPTSRQDEQSARMTAAWTPEVFGRVLARFGPDPLTRECRQWLVDLGVPSSSCTRLIKVFLDVVATVGYEAGLGPKPAHFVSPAHLVSPRAAAPPSRAGHTLLFQYKMIDGTAVSIDLQGETDHAEVLRVIESWIAFKKSEMSRSSERPKALPR